MARKILFFAFVLSLCSFMESSEVKRTTHPFSQGEIVTYRLHYGMFNAGTGTVYIDDKIHTVNDKPCYKMNIYGKTIGSFKAIMKIKDTWRTYADTSTLAPQRFYRNISENKYKLKETSFFKPDKKIVNVHKERKGKTNIKSYPVPDNVHDLVSAYFFLRDLDYAGMKVGDKRAVNVFFEDTVYNFKIEYRGKAVVKTKLGKINAFKIRPLMPDQSLFDGEDSILFYISDDKNKLPLKVRAKMFVGAVECDIVATQGLKHPLNKVKK